jgi:Transposase, Mutator family
LIPILYLKGISTGDFAEALAAVGLSASTVARLKDAWVEEHLRWSKRDLTAKRYVYFWVDGIYVQARLEDDAQCLLVIVGATPEGKKEFVGLADGVRESTQSGGALRSRGEGLFTHAPARGCTPESTLRGLELMADLDRDLIFAQRPVLNFAPDLHDLKRLGCLTRLFDRIFERVLYPVRRSPNKAVGLFLGEQRRWRRRQKNCCNDKGSAHCAVLRVWPPPESN